MTSDLAPLVDRAITRYKEKMASICLDCPRYPNDCPPKRCPHQIGVKLPSCATKATLFNMIKGQSRALKGKGSSRA
ncbi:MAG: hypothetical protein APR55_10475 [Methanolinea sp. SDB]|nr:MAG: hypothetical protein APR55_10475 [Methanolinea sp. SDB]